MSTRTGERPPKPDSGYRPDVPISVSPLFDWPPRPVALLAYIVAPTLLPLGIVFIAGSVLLWTFLTPHLGTIATGAPWWIGLLYVRNAALVIVVAGGLHIHLYRRRAQDQEFKYSARWLSTTNRTFLWRDQTRDNMFWSLTSGAAIWTLWEAATLWLYATGRIPSVSWSDRPIYLAALMVGAFFWSTLHFYLTHRLLHVGGLYRVAHALHHRNVNTGPWSGISMHPIEHLIYFSTPLLFWLVPAHPTVVIVVLLFSGVSPAISHSGFERVRLHSGTTIGAGDYFHHLHHRYFECNYGNRLVPLDKVFGTFHDGTGEAHALMRTRRSRAGR